MDPGPDMAVSRPSPRPPARMAAGSAARRAGVLPRVLLAMACVPAAFVVYGVAFGLASLAGVGTDGSAVVSQLAGSAALAALAALLWRGLPTHLARLAVVSHGPAARTAVTGLAFGLAMVAGATAIIGLGTWIDPTADHRLRSVQYTTGGAAWQDVLLAISLVVLAPVGEELLFRGLVFRALAMRLPVGWAMLVSGALFAASHPDGWLLWPRALALVAMGTALAWWYRRRGYLGSAAAHAGVNLVALVALLAS